MLKKIFIIAAMVGLVQVEAKDIKVQSESLDDFHYKVESTKVEEGNRKISGEITDADIQNKNAKEDSQHEMKYWKVPVGPKY